MLLTPTQTRQLFTHALEHGYAVLAINADSPACLTDALEAALEAQAPLLIETSLWQLRGRSFGAGDPELGMARYLAQLELMLAAPRYADLAVGFHTDHIKGPGAVDLLKGAIRGLSAPWGVLRPSSVSLDSSDMTEAENIATALELCTAAREAQQPLTLEVEAGVDDGLTPLDQAERILGAIEAAAPGVLALWAPGVGTQHGLQEGGFPSFSPAHIAAHHALATGVLGRPTGLALHGSSGLSDDDLRAGIASGVAKVNWSSESLLIRSRAALEYHQRFAEDFSPSSKAFKTTVMDNGVQSHVAATYLPAVLARLEVLNARGQGPRFWASLRDLHPA